MYWADFLRSASSLKFLPVARRAALRPGRSLVHVSKHSEQRAITIITRPYGLARRRCAGKLKQAGSRLQVLI